GFRREAIGYSMEETKLAIQIKKTMVQASGGLQATVLMNTSYLSTITCDEGTFQASEIPVFVVLTKDLTRRFVDTQCRVYVSVSEVIDGIGSLFKGGIMYAQDLNHKPTGNGDQVTLLYTETTATTLHNRTKKLLETTLACASVALGVASVAVSMPLGVVIRAAAGMRFFSAAMSITEDAVVNSHVDLSTYCHNARYACTNDKIMCTYDDCYCLSESVFSLYNLVITPWTISDLLKNGMLSGEPELQYTQFLDNTRDKGGFVLRSLVQITENDQFLIQTSRLVKRKWSKCDEPAILAPSLNCQIVRSSQNNNECSDRNDLNAQFATLFVTS
ncbi:hypothetical protein PENTCL1PPCAC_9534, partial [Pristionchus entomophagus]